MIATMITSVVLMQTLLTQTTSTDLPSGVGGVMAPAVLPSASNAVYGLVGAPEVGVGYRQGFALLEFEARALFNIFELAAIVEPGVRVRVYERDKFQLGVGGALGLSFNSGSKYFDLNNFGSIALRPRVSGLASYEFSELVSGLAQLDLPLAISLNVIGTQFTPTLGAGVEFHVGGSLSLLVLGNIGVDAIKESLGVTQVRPAWGVHLGVGYRIF